MPETTQELIRRYLQDAVAAESHFETQLRAFSQEGDDEEVQLLFAQQADQTRRHYDWLAARLDELGSSPSGAKAFFAHVLGLAPKFAQAAHSQEERTVQNLIAAFTIEHGACATYEALANIAYAAGDTITEALARQIQSEEREAAETVWRSIPSRSKIAFNLLTATEVDPAVETRTADNRLVS